MSRQCSLRVLRICNSAEAEAKAAKGFGMSEEQFRASKAELVAKELRKQNRGQELGEVVSQILAELGPEYLLHSVTWNADTLSWVLEIEKEKSHLNVVLSWELIDDVLDSKSSQELRRLRNMVFFGIGRHDLVGAKA